MNKDHAKTDIPKVDPEFEALIKPLDCEELRLLANDIIETRECREALTVWKETNILLDGHNRKNICEQNDIPYMLRYISLPDRDAAKEWILSNQLGRRNLVDSDRVLYIGRLYKLIRGSQGGNNTVQKDSSGKKAVKGNTAAKLAKQHNVSERTVRNSASLADAVDELRSVDPDIEKKLKSKQVTKQAVLKAAKYAVKDPEKAKELLIKGQTKEAYGVKHGSIADEMAGKAIGILQKIPADDPGYCNAMDRVCNFCDDARTKQRFNH